MKSKLLLLNMALGAFFGSLSVSQAALIVHYKLDEGTGVTAGDSGSAPAAPGTLTGSGSTWVQDNPAGTGYSYSVNDSSISYISAGVVEKLEGMGDMTISFWTKLSAVQVNDRIFSTRSGAGNGAIDIVATSTDVNNMTFRLELSPGYGNSINATSSAFDASDWVFVAMVRNASAGTVQIYLGGTEGNALVNGGLTTGLAGNTDINQNSGDFRIGGTASTALNRTPTGYLSDFRIYDEALGESAVNAIRYESIPEPSTLAFVGLAGVAILWRRRARAGR